MQRGEGAVPAAPVPAELERLLQARRRCRYLFVIPRPLDINLVARLARPNQARATGRCPRAERPAWRRAFPRFIPGCAAYFLPGEQLITSWCALCPNAHSCSHPVPRCVIQTDMCVPSHPSQVLTRHTAVNVRPDGRCDERHDERRGAACAARRAARRGAARRAAQRAAQRAASGLAHDAPVCADGRRAGRRGYVRGSVCAAAQWCGSVRRAVRQRAACAVRRRAVDALHEPVSSIRCVSG